MMVKLMFARLRGIALRLRSIEQEIRNFVCCIYCHRLFIKRYFVFSIFYSVYAGERE